MTAVVFQLDRSTREVELGLEYGPPVMNIGGQSWKFEDGQWITGIDREPHHLILHVLLLLLIFIQPTQH